MNTSRKPLVNATRVLWKTQAKPKKVGPQFAGSPRVDSSVGEQKTKIKRNETVPKSKCGPGQPPRPHSYVVSCSALSPRGGGMTASARQRSQRSAAFAKASHRFVILRSRTGNRCGGQRSVLLRRAGWGRRPQCPGNQSRLRAFSGVSPGNSPSRIAGCRWLCRNHSASSGTLTFR
jgi:hypothetical protein